jgi:hypothetical protein
MCTQATSAGNAQPARSTRYRLVAVAIVQSQPGGRAKGIAVSSVPRLLVIVDATADGEVDALVVPGHEPRTPAPRVFAAAA